VEGRVGLRYSLLRGITVMSSDALEMALASWPLLADAHAHEQRQEALDMLLHLCGAATT
jgi:hypothetical protein